MSVVSAENVKKLRDMTNLPMMECKAALSEASGDLDKAVQLLREKNAKASIKRADREAAEGRIAAFVDPDRKIGAIVEVRCESPMVVKSEHFIALGNDIAKHIAEQNPASVDDLLKQSFAPGKTVNDRIVDAVGLIRENMKVARFARYEGVLGEYCHHDGSVGVMFQATGEVRDRQILRDVCMHITAAVPTPIAVQRSEVAADLVEKEKEIIKAQVAADPKNTGKPAQIIDKIAEGKLNDFFKQNVLTEQAFVKDPSKSVGQLLKSAGLEAVKFSRFKVGEIPS